MCTVQENGLVAGLFIRMSELRILMGGVSRKLIYGMMESGELPRPYKFGQRVVAWKTTEVVEALDKLRPEPEKADEIIMVRRNFYDENGALITNNI